jgi:hypothetical protein
MQDHSFRRAKATLFSSSTVGADLADISVVLPFHTILKYSVSRKNVVR